MVQVSGNIHCKFEFLPYNMLFIQDIPGNKILQPFKTLVISSDLMIYPGRFGCNQDNLISFLHFCFGNAAEIIKLWLVYIGIKLNIRSPDPIIMGKGNGKVTPFLSGLPDANAALLVTLNPKDFPGDGPLAGMYWQEEIEQKAYIAGGKNYFAPAQRVGDFLSGVPSAGPGGVNPTYRPGVTWCDLHQVLPHKIPRALAKAIPLLDGNLKGFADPDAVLTAPETRSSSPVRILRDESRQCQIRGLYPTGEGAGYAGGIMSAAIDGIMTAEAIIEAI